MSDSSSSDSDDDIEVPSREECQERIEKFVSVTGTDEVMTRVIRGVGGWFKRPKKCLTPSEDENSKNRLKIWQIPIQS